VKLLKKLGLHNGMLYVFSGPSDTNFQIDILQVRATESAQQQRQERLRLAKVLAK
jgi:hypothetical protein